MIVMTPADGDYRRVVDRLVRSKPIGALVVERGTSSMVTIMGERAGFAIMDDPRAARVWKKNIAASDGAHLLIVTDRLTNYEEPDPNRPGLDDRGAGLGGAAPVARRPS